MTLIIIRMVMRPHTQHRLPHQVAVMSLFVIMFCYEGNVHMRLLLKRWILKAKLCKQFAHGVYRDSSSALT